MFHGYHPDLFRHDGSRSRTIPPGIAGIESVLLGVDTFNVVLPGGSLLGGIRLQVDEENAEEARGIVQDGDGVTPITDDFVPPDDTVSTETAGGEIEPASAAKFPNFRGTYTALITPFRDGRVDAEAFARFNRISDRG